MLNIQKFVFFDLESTGLKEIGRPRISEISMVAVNTKEFLELHSKIIDAIESNKFEGNDEYMLPRIIYKLTLCFYPMAPTTSMAKQDSIRAQ